MKPLPASYYIVCGIIILCIVGMTGLAMRHHP